MYVQSVLGGASAAGQTASSDIVNAISTVLRAALPTGFTQLADNGDLPLQTQIQNAVESLTGTFENGIPAPPQPDSQEVTQAVQVQACPSRCIMLIEI